MSNESPMAIGNDYSVDIPHPLSDKPYKLNFVVSLRNNPPDAMVVETITHFCHAVSALANGMDCRDDRKQRSAFGQIPESAYNRVLISYADIPILCQDEHGEDHHVWKKVLIFSEHTSADQFMEACYAAVNLDSIVAEIGIVRTQYRSNTPKQPKQEAQQPQPAANNGGEVVIEAWDNREKENYEQAHKGKHVQIRFGKLQRMIKAKKDGTGMYEVIEFYPLLPNGNVGNYNAYALSVFVPTPERADTAYDYMTLDKDDFVETFLGKGGAELNAIGTARFKVNPSKTDDRIYWNFAGLEFDEELVMPLEMDQAPPEVYESDPRSEYEVRVADGYDSSEDVPF